MENADRREIRQICVFWLVRDFEVNFCATWDVPERANWLKSATNLNVNILLNRLNYLDKPNDMGYTINNQGDKNGDNKINYHINRINNERQKDF